MCKSPVKTPQKHKETARLAAVEECGLKIVPLCCHMCWRDSARASPDTARACHLPAPRAESASLFSFSL